jgi:hypothetical protein
MPEIRKPRQYLICEGPRRPPLLDCKADSSAHFKEEKKSPAPVDAELSLATPAVGLRWLRTRNAWNWN